MFTLPFRIGIASLGVVSAYYLLSTGNRFGYAVILASILVLAGYFRYGPIRPAFFAMTRGQFDRARQLIDSIKYPGLLSPQSKAYLHWIRAAIAMHDGDAHIAKNQMRLAREGSLRTSNDRCIATALLAEYHAADGDRESALKLIEEARRLPHSQRNAEMLDSLAEKLANAG